LHKDIPFISATQVISELHGNHLLVVLISRVAQKTSTNVSSASYCIQH